MSTTFTGKRVLITGSGGLFGRELSDAFRKQGASMILLDCVAPALPVTAGQPRQDAAPDSPACQDAATAAAARPDHVITVDLRDADALARHLAAMHDDDLPDIVINNAAIFPFVDLLDVDAAQCRQIIDVNLIAPLQLTQAIAKRWIARSRKGVIVNVSSASAEVARTNGAIYGASKAALEQLTRMLAIRLGNHGIRVNAVRPGIADDPAHPQLPQAHLATIAAAVPLGRTIAPGELAQAVMFLSSDASSFTTGQVLSVDGGGGLNRRAPVVETKERIES